MVEFLSPEITEEHFEALEQGQHQARQGLLLTCQGPDFALGASLDTLAGNIERQEWDELERRGRRYQQINLSLRRSAVPVVAALRGHVLGAGCEIALHCHSLVVTPEARMGLVESRAGLLPAAGGTQEMTRRAETPGRLMKFLSNLVRGRLAADAGEGAELGYLDPSRDRICQDPTQLLPAARARLCELGSQPRPIPAGDVEVLCGYAELCAQLKGWGLSAYDLELGRAIAGVMCAGQQPGSRVSLEKLLDLERQTLRDLVVRPRTQARIRHLLKAGLLAERRDRSS